MILLVFVAFVDLFVPVFSVLIVVRVLLSYFVKPENRLMGWLISLTEPAVGLVRRAVPATMGWDLAPLVTLLLMQGVQYLADGLIHP
jgi:uncharacterized protein YggT (Ycf19 family)